MDSIEAVVAHIQALSSDPQEIPHLHSILKQSDDSLHSQHPSRLSPFFQRLDPSIHSLGYLYLLFMALSKKLGAIDEHLSCDPAYVNKLGRDRPKYEFDDLDFVPHKFP